MINTLILKQKDPIAYNDLLESQGEPSELTDHELAIINMDAYKAIDTFLNYNGIIGYTNMILHAVDAIRASEVKPLRPTKEDIAAFNEHP
jgi:hypothetical protein